MECDGQKGKGVLYVHRPTSQLVDLDNSTKKNMAELATKGAWPDWPPGSATAMVVT